MTEIGTKGAPVVRMTDAALAMVSEVRASEEGEESLALWVEISGSAGGASPPRSPSPSPSPTASVEPEATAAGVTVLLPADGAFDRIDR